MAVDATTVANPAPPADDAEFVTYSVRVHRSVPPTFDIAAALEAFSQDTESFGRLHFNYKPREWKPATEKREGHWSNPSISIDTQDSRRAATTASVDAEAQRMAARAIKAALRDPNKGAALSDIMKRLAAGGPVTRDEVMAAFDPGTFAQITASLKPDNRGRKPAQPTA